MIRSGRDKIETPEQVGLFLCRFAIKIDHMNSCTITHLQVWGVIYFACTV